MLGYRCTLVEPGWDRNILQNTETFRSEKRKQKWRLAKNTEVGHDDKMRLKLKGFPGRFTNLALHPIKVTQ
jgi:hypothetical protein